ncbi:MAG: hypothetical protein F6K19_22085 [Cyanothece sp. SIO1E1]|nr:hypothetical protein [Cyanothece sp. SIO1E1]
MNILKITTTTLATCLTSVGIIVGNSPLARADYQSFKLAPDFLPDPAIGTGESGGDRWVEDCGYVDLADSPDHVLTLTSNFNYLKAQVYSSGDVTLLIDGPLGRICVDNPDASLAPAFEDAWPAGTYHLWIGDFGKSFYQYQLFFTESK